MDFQTGSSIPPSGAPPRQDPPQVGYQPPQAYRPPTSVHQYAPPEDTYAAEAPVQPESFVGYQPPMQEHMQPPMQERRYEPAQPPMQEPGPSPEAPPQPDETPTQQQQPFNPAALPEYLKPPVEEVVYQWTAPSRPFKQRNRRYFTTVVTIALLISLILFFAGQFLPIAVVVAVAFLAYIMATIPPHMVANQITTFGIRIEDDLYFWEELGWFWFTKKYADTLLNIEVGRFPNRLMLLVGDANQDDLRYILEAVLVENTPPPTYFEKVAAWLQEKIPLDVD